MPSSYSPRGLAALGALFLLSSCTGASGPSSAPTLDIVDPAASIATAREALAADATDRDAWFLLARGFEAQSQPDSAVAAYEELVALDPDDVRSVVHHGLALEKVDLPEEALAAYLRATELAPDDPVPYINLGSLQYFHYKRTFEAKMALSRALELDPKNADAHFNMGVLFADAGLYQEAMVEWEAVLEHSKDGPARNLAEENLARIRPLVEPIDSPAEDAS